MSVSQNDPKMKTLSLATKQEILALTTSSLTLEEIALQVGVSKSTVFKIYKAKKIKKSKSQKGRKKKTVC